MNGWEVLYYLLQIYRIVIFLRVVMSWVAPMSRHPLVEFLDSVTEPVIRPVRNLMPNLGGLDLSPLVVVLLLTLLMGIVGQMAYA